MPKKAAPPPAPEPVDVIVERKATHGDWKPQAICAQNLKQIVRSNVAFRQQEAMKAGEEVSLKNDQLEALEMIMVKCSRIIHGDATEEDHWDDIIGYARLGRGDSQDE